MVLVSKFEYGEIFGMVIDKGKLKYLEKILPAIELIIIW